MGFEQLLAMIKAVKEQELERRTLCPKCEYELSENCGILYCEWCGWTEN